MATYRVTAPDGSVYNVTPPDGANVSPEQILSQVQGQHQAQPKDEYANKSPDELKQLYRQAKLVNAGDAVLAKISDAFVESEAKHASTLGGIGLSADTVMRQIAGGVPVIGAGLDELNAGTTALLGGDYGEALDYNRARDRQAHRDAPALSTALNVGGAIAGTLAGARYLGAGVGSEIPVAQRALYGAAAAAPVGAADFFLRGEGGAANRSIDAGAGAVAGGVLGAAAPVVGAGLSAGARKVFDVLTSNEALAKLGISPQAAKLLLKRLTDSGADMGQGAENIRAAGPDAMVADAGDATSNLLDTALARSGQGSTAARSAIEARAANANKQLSSSLDEALGPGQGAETQGAAIRGGTKEARSTAYDAAYEKPIDYSSAEGLRLEGLLKRVDPGAIRYANSLMRKFGEASRQIKATVNEDGTVSLERMPDVRQWDWITKSLNDAAYSSEGRGALGGFTQSGGADKAIAGEARRLLRQLVPEYGTALDTAADTAGRVTAAKFGSKLLDPSVTREEAAAELADLSVAERGHLLSSVRQAVDDVAAKVTQMASDPNIDARELRATLGKLTSRSAREKLSMAIGDPNKVRALYGQIGRVQKALELRASVAKNSRTFGRQADQAASEAIVEPGVIRSAIGGSPVGAVKKIMQRLAGIDPERRAEALDKLWGEVANALTTVRGPKAEAFARNLKRAVEARFNAQAPSVGIGRLGQSAFAGAVTTPARQLIPNSR